MLDYGVNEFGVITDPGKFEGESVWVPMAYDDYLDGCWEDDGIGGAAYIEVTEENRLEWGLNDSTFAVSLFFSDYGFIHGEEYIESEYKIFLDSYVEYRDDDYDEDNEEVDGWEDDDWC